MANSTRTTCNSSAGRSWKQRRRGWRHGSEPERIPNLYEELYFLLEIYSHYLGFWMHGPRVSPQIVPLFWFLWDVHTYHKCNVWNKCIEFIRILRLQEKLTEYHIYCIHGDRPLYSVTWSVPMNTSVPVRRIRGQQRQFVINCSHILRRKHCGKLIQ